MQIQRYCYWLTDRFFCHPHLRKDTSCWSCFLFLYMSPSGHALGTPFLSGHPLLRYITDIHSPRGNLTYRAPPTPPHPHPQYSAKLVLQCSLKCAKYVTSGFQENVCDAPGVQPLPYGYRLAHRLKTPTRDGKPPELNHRDIICY